MFAVCVRFEINARDMQQFLPLMQQQARNSRQLEPGCHVFDICTSETGETVFLYELYADAEAFQAHLASDHFQAFDAAVAPMIRTKEVSTYSTVQRS